MVHFGLMKTSVFYTILNFAGRVFSFWILACGFLLVPLAQAETPLLLNSQAGASMVMTGQVQRVAGVDTVSTLLKSGYSVDKEGAKLAADAVNIQGRYIPDPNRYGYQKMILNASKLTVIAGLETSLSRWTSGKDPLWEKEGAEKFRKECLFDEDVDSALGPVLTRDFLSKLGPTGKYILTIPVRGERGNCRYVLNEGSYRLIHGSVVLDLKLETPDFEAQLKSDGLNVVIPHLDSIPVNLRCDFKSATAGLCIDLTSDTFITNFIPGRYSINTFSTSVK